MKHPTVTITKYNYPETYKQWIEEFKQSLLKDMRENMVSTTYFDNLECYLLGEIKNAQLYYGEPIVEFEVDINSLSINIYPKTI